MTGPEAAAVHGHTDPAFTPLRELAASHLRSGDETGLSLHVRRRGRVLVDLWGGTDGAGTPWRRDTIVNLWSLTKIVTTLAVLHAADHGRFRLGDPLARYWPEFGAAGKGRVTIEQLLSHTSGVAGWDRPFGLDDLYDHPTAAGRLAAQETWWPPGTGSGYAAVSFGTPAAELLRHTHGLTLRDYVATHVAAGLRADVQVGLRRGDAHRTARLVPPSSPPELPEPRPPLFTRTFTAPRLSAEVAATPAWRRADIGAANGHGNARSMALIGAALLAASVNGVRVRDLAFEPRSDGTDLVLGLPLRWGLGIALSGRDTRELALPDDGVGYWGGWGGSLLVVDPHRDVVMAYVMNRMSSQLLGSERARSYISYAYDLL